MGISDPGAKWSTVDRGLAEGLLFYEAGLNSLGIPSEIATDEANADMFEVEPVIDYAQAVIDRYRGAENYKPEPGEALRVRMTAASSDPADEEPLERMMREKREALAASNDEASGEQ
jgi:hypothetical protein